MPDTLLEGQQLSLGDSISSFSGTFQLVFQGSDGNLVLSIVAGGTTAALQNRPIWAAYTQNRGAKRCIMQQDGNLVVYDDSNQPLWNSGTNGNPGAFLVVQDDGNAVIYNPELQPLWQTATSAAEAPGVNA